MYIRLAEEKDIDSVIKLLTQVLNIHAKIRPDIFIGGTTKYTKEEQNDQNLEHFFYNHLFFHNLL